MVLRNSDPTTKMANEQPLKKRIRIGDAEEAMVDVDDGPAQDETDFISNGVFHLNTTTSTTPLTNTPLPLDMNEDDRNTLNIQQKCPAHINATSNGKEEPNLDNDTSIQPAPDIPPSLPQNSTDTSSISTLTRTQNISLLEQQLIEQCLCELPDSAFISLQNSCVLSEGTAIEILEFLSALQLLFDVYLKQNNQGLICARIVAICDWFVRNEQNLVEQIISLSDTRNTYVNFMACRVFSSFLIIAKTHVNNEWLEAVIGFLTLDSVDYIKMNFGLEVIKRVVEWKSLEIHVLEEPQTSTSAAGTSNQSIPGATHSSNKCMRISFTDAESFDTAPIKGLLIKSLEAKWQELVSKIEYAITHDTSIEAQTCILTFLGLWESTLSIRANLSVNDTKPFNAHLEYFVDMLHSNLKPIIWNRLLSLYNEVLCYGSTLALQDILPEDTCQLAHLIMRSVKDCLLDRMPYRRQEGYAVNSFVGTIVNASTVGGGTEEYGAIDKTLLQKMALLVLKSVAITIKETRYDSSDTSVDSEEYEDFSEDMQVIARSIRDVLRRLDAFMKQSLEFHPETAFPKILVHLFSDQDDYMIESMVCTLDIATGVLYEFNAPDVKVMLNPVHTFIEFLKVVNHDSDVLLDYLVSNETCFLLYLLKFLKYIRRNWDRFVSGCTEGGRTNELDNTMTVLIRLKMQIERLVNRNLFPYKISPVLKLLEKCENMYEGDEYS